MGVVSRRWMWVESMSVASGCGCKEEYRFPNINYPYIHVLLLYLLFFATASLLFCSFKKMFFVLVYVIFVKFYNKVLLLIIRIFWSSSIIIINYIQFINYFNFINNY